MGIEFELKYRATSRLLEQLRQDLPGEEKSYQMQTTYYDTPTGQFSIRHYTLRRRLENGISVCTLKTPAAGQGRWEWEVENDRIEEAVKELCKLDTPRELRSLADQGLVPICGAKFKRITKTLDLGGCVIEIALDTGILTGGDRQIPLCEVEVELKQGEERSCVAFAQNLVRKYGLEPEERSKFRRALALYRGEE
ncbi:MAG: CYTH domain-containing protein [Oscillospiraceae bacterium]|nr:CYTH domain-containing protein [Oscillospiraceae bacterium]